MRSCKCFMCEGSGYDEYGYECPKCIGYGIIQVKDDDDVKSGESPPARD